MPKYPLLLTMNHLADFLRLVMIIRITLPTHESLHDS